MPLTLLPAVDLRDGRAVRPRRDAVGGATDRGDDPLAVARGFAEQGCAWLHVVDLDAAFSDRPRNRHLIAPIADATGCRIQASGGIHTLADVRASLGYGAERVVIGTTALLDRAFVAAALDEAGPRLVVALDSLGTTLRARGRTAGGGDLFEAIETLAAMGVRRFVHTDVARDGMLRGPNLDLLGRVADAAGGVVTAGGGVASLDDLAAIAAVHRRVDSVIVGGALHAGRFTVARALEVCAGDPT